MVVIFQIGHSHNTGFRKFYKINWSHILNSILMLKMFQNINQSVDKLVRALLCIILCLYIFDLVSLLVSADIGNLRYFISQYLLAGEAWKID